MRKRPVRFRHTAAENNAQSDVCDRSMDNIKISTTSSPAESGPKPRSIRRQIDRMLIMISVSMVCVAALLSLMLISVNRQYEDALLCANTAAGFNKEFKSTLDLAMYNHVIRPRSEVSAEDLPMEELDMAEEVLRRLEETTSLPDNQWRARSMLDMCSNLRTYMIEIANTESYDRRMDLLERNIRGETGLTVLIEDYMHAFMDDEVQELARLVDSLHTQSFLLIVVTVVLMAAVTGLIVFYSLHTARGIADPIRELSDKAERFGANEYTGEPVKTEITELRNLDQTFDSMAERIHALLEKQMEDQQSLHRAELELLQAQINPHFLYNTLDSIAILAESEREEDVVDMVTSLSTFFRNSLSDGQDIIPLRSEVAQATSYLEIQQIRYSDIMNYEIDVPEDIMDCMVPKLILQPLIENALYHGIKNRRGRGTIRITGLREENDLLLKVRDNGAGIEPGHLRELQAGVFLERHGGLGLKNVSQRIRLYCGEGYGLQFWSEAGSGTEVTIRLPSEGVIGIRKQGEQEGEQV